MPTEKKDTPKTQLEKFIEAAHKLECDVTEEEFDKALKDITSVPTFIGVNSIGY